LRQRPSGEWQKPNRRQQAARNLQRPRAESPDGSECTRVRNLRRMDAAQYRQAQSNSLLQALFGRISHFRTGRNGWTKTELCEAAGMEPITAAKMLANFDELDLWRGLLNYKSPGIRLQTLQYLTDRRDGKARQAVNVSGGRVRCHTAHT